MSGRKYNARGKVTQKLTRDGLVERNAATGAEERISKRSADFDIRGDKADDRALSQAGTRAGSGQSLKQRSRAAYRQVREQDIPAADVAETKQNTPLLTAADDIKSEISGTSPVATAPETPDAHARDENTTFKQENVIPRHTLSVKSKSLPGKQQYYRQFTEQQSQPPITATEPQSREPIADYTDSAVTPPETESKLITERESKLNTDGNSTLQFSRDETPPQGSKSHPKQQDGKFTRTDAESVQVNADAAQSPAQVTPVDVADAPVVPIPIVKPKQRQPTLPQSGAISQTGGTPNADTASAAPTPPEQQNADAGVAGVPTAAHSLLKEPETALKPDKKSKLQFTTDEAPPQTSNPGKKLSKAQKQAEKTSAQLDKARGKLPAKRKLRTKVVVNEETGKPKRKLYFDKEVKSQSEHLKGPLPLRPVKAAGNSALAFGHRKMFQVEKENVGTEAAHKGEMFAEGGIRAALRHGKTAPYRKVAKLERKSAKKSINLIYQKTLAENPKLKSNLLSRAFQKRKIKKDYAKAAREAQKAAKTAKKAGGVAVDAGKVVAGVVKRHPVATATVILIALLLFMLMSLFGAFGGMGSGGLGGILASSYLSDDVDIDNAELAYTGWEADLQAQIANTERDHSGYDEYRYNIGDISHNPYELMAYLTAVYQDFTYGAIESDLRALFNEQYLLSFTESVETKYNDPDDANGDGDREPYDWRVLTVTLSARSFTDVAHSHMTDDQRQQYDILMQTKGSRQYIANPLGLNWLPRITSGYGWYINPATGAKEYHTGVNIGVPVGTNVNAGQDGTVSVGNDAHGNYVTITGANGLVVKYGNLNGISASNGQTVKMGDSIGTSGSDLYLELSRDGQYLNPLYFADTGDTGIGPVYGNPGLPMGDGSYAALIAEAEQYLGYPYVWGGSNPSTSFDCSGFVCWVLNQSGAANVGRTTAQGLYNLCAPISQSEAQPGDLVFFTGTYSSINPVTHVGIYVGYVNGHPTMIAAGDPIQYTAIDTPYWIAHAYSYGRLAANN